LEYIQLRIVNLLLRNVRRQLRCHSSCFHPHKRKNSQLRQVLDSDWRFYFNANTRGSINGNVNALAGSTLTPDDMIGTLTIQSNITLSGLVVMAVNRTNTRRATRWQA